MANTNDEQAPAAPGDVKPSATAPGGQTDADDPAGPTTHTGGDGPQPVEPPGALHIRLDRQDLEVSPVDLHDGALTGEQIRERANPPIGADRDIFEIVPGGSDRKIGDDDTVEIRDHIRFFSAPRNINPGMAFSASRWSSRSPCERSARHAAG